MRVLVPPGINRSCTKTDNFAPFREWEPQSCGVTSEMSRFSCKFRARGIVCVGNEPEATRDTLPSRLHVSARPDLGAVRALTAKARKKMIPRRFPGLILLGWR